MATAADDQSKEQEGARLATVRLGSGSGVMCPNLNLHLMVRFCHVEFRDRYSPSFSVCFRPFSFILHSFPSILCYSPMLFYPLPSPRHTPLFRHTRSFRHIPSHSVTLRHILSFPSHPIFRPFFHLYPFIPSHPFIFPYWDPTVPSSDLNLYSGSILVSATTPIIPTPLCSGLLLYYYFYCSMIRSVLIVPFRIYSDKL